MSFEPIQIARPLVWASSLMMFLDAALTYSALKNTSAVEINPIMDAAFRAYGLELALSAKAIIGTLCVFSLGYTVLTGWSPLSKSEPDKVRRHAVYLLVGVLAVMSMVVGNNVQAIVSTFPHTP